MEISNDTLGKALGVPIKLKDGRELLAVILKYTFAVSARGQVEPALDGPEPYLVDEYNGEDPSTSSIRKPSDLFDEKPGTDVLLVGHAHPPVGKKTFVDVGFSVGPMRKAVRVHGVRVWQAGTFGGLAPGPARPISEPIPLLYELAWGGMDMSDPARPLGEPRNYVGRGVARDARKLVGEPAAQIEAPESPLGRGDNVPAGLGAVHRHWQPRIAFAGTYDQAWKENKMPLPPDDYDPRFNISVPHDQWSPRPLQGDEPIEVTGATPEGLWRFQLPRLTPGFSSFLGEKRREHRTHLESILIDADAMRVELTFRAGVPLPPKYEQLRKVEVFEKRLLG